MRCETASPGSSLELVPTTSHGLEGGTDPVGIHRFERVQRSMTPVSIPEEKEENATRCLKVACPHLRLRVHPIGGCVQIRAGALRCSMMRSDAI